MGEDHLRKQKRSMPGRSIWPSIELFLWLLLVHEVGAVIHQVSS